MRKLLLSSCLTAATVFSMGAIAQSQPPANDGNDRLPAPLQLPIDIGYTYFPSSAANEFRLAEAGVTGGPDITCSGVSMDGTFSAMTGAVRSLTGQLQENALGLSINYLIYSSPSLYALITNMKESFESSLNMANASCNMARSLGKKNWDEESNKARVAQCLDREGGLSDQCLKGSEGTVYRVLEKKREWTAAIDSKIQEFNELTGGGCEALDSSEPTVMQMVFVRSPNQCGDLELASDLVGDRKLNEEDGESEPVAATKKISDVISEKAESSRGLIDAIVSAPTGEMTTTDAYKELTGRNTVSFSASQQRMLKALRAEDQLRYEAYRDRLATMMAINQLETTALRLKVGLQAGSSNSGGAELGESNRRFVQEQIEYLLSIAELERKKISNQQMEANLLDQGYRLLQQSRVN